MPMKTLYPAQLESAAKLFPLLQQNLSTLDASDVGTGKTVVAANMLRELNRPAAVVCPKAVIPSWERELAEVGVDPLFVLNYEKLRTGNTEFVIREGKDKNRFQWRLPKDTVLLFDEVHFCKGAYTQNAYLFITAIQQGYTCHVMSGTAAKDPTEMRALGYALNLHGLNKNDPSTKQYSWYVWMKWHGCDLNAWRKWEFRRCRVENLTKIHSILFGDGGRAVRLTAKDFPDSFRQNRVFIEPVQFSKLKQIQKAYDDNDVTPEIIEQFIEDGTVEDSIHTLVNILRARQLAEAFKVVDFIKIAKDLLAEGYAVPLFMNFRDSVDAIGDALDCPIITGGQSIKDRQDAIDAFQNDEVQAIAVNIAAGGTGISLHDHKGARQRVSLISPTFSEKQYLQALGRTHRNGAHTDSVQRVLVAKDSIEEAVMKAVLKKVENLNLIHGEAV